MATMINLTGTKLILILIGIATITYISRSFLNKFLFNISPDIIPNQIYDGQIDGRLELEKEGLDEGSNAQIVNHTLPGPNFHTIYNRVPKCGSSSLMNLINETAQDNQFLFISRIVHRGAIIHYDDKMRTNFCNKFGLSIQPFSLYAEHVRFIDCSSSKFLKENKFNWINQVHHPVARFQSQFQYSLYLRGRGKSDQAKAQLLSTSFDNCILKKQKDCLIKTPSMMVTYFSGYAKHPLNFATAIPLAKYNVEKHYSVVGLLEDMPMTLTVLEAYFPILFKGLSKKQLPMTNPSTHQNISQQVQDKLNNMLAPEIDLYDFLKQRLIKQYNQLML